MRRECRERFPHHQLQRKPLMSDPDMHYDTCVTHVPWFISVSLTRGGGESVPAIPGACATLNCTYLVRGPWVSNHITCKVTAEITYRFPNFHGWIIKLFNCTPQDACNYLSMFGSKLINFTNKVLVCRYGDIMLDHSALIRRLGFESPSGRDIFCIEIIDTSTRTWMLLSTQSQHFKW